MRTSDGAYWSAPQTPHTHTHQYAQTRPTTSTTSENMPTSRSACLDLSQYHSSNSNNNSTATDKDYSHSKPNHPPTTHVAHYWGTEPNTAATFSGCLSRLGRRTVRCVEHVCCCFETLNSRRRPALPMLRQAARSLRPGSTLSHGPPKGLACFRMRRWRVRFAVRY